MTINEVPAFLDEDAIAAELDIMAEAANASCSQVYELFVAKFSAAVDSRFDLEPAEIREMAHALARERGYASPAEVEAMLNVLPVVPAATEEDFEDAVY